MLSINKQNLLLLTLILLSFFTLLASLSIIVSKETPHLLGLNLPLLKYVLLFISVGTLIGALFLSTGPLTHKTKRESLQTPYVPYLAYPAALVALTPAALILNKSQSDNILFGISANSAWLLVVILQVLVLTIYISLLVLKMPKNA